MSYETKGKIQTIAPTEEISGGKYSKKVFTVTNNDGYQGKEKLLAFEIFEKADGGRIDNFTDECSEGDEVEVTFDIDTNENKGRYFTTLKAFRIVPMSGMAEAKGGETKPQTKDVTDEDIPF